MVSNEVFRGRYRQELRGAGADSRQPGAGIPLQPAHPELHLQGRPPGDGAGAEHLVPAHRPQPADLHARASSTPRRRTSCGPRTASTDRRATRRGWRFRWWPRRDGDAMPLGARLAAFAAGLVLVSSVAAAQDHAGGRLRRHAGWPAGGGRLPSRTVDRTAAAGRGHARRGADRRGRGPCAVQPAALADAGGLALHRPRSASTNRAERRVLKFRTRQLSITGDVLQVVATEDPAQFKKLLDDVGANEDSPPTCS